MSSSSVLLIISGGIAACKSLDVIRRLREESVFVLPVLTRAAEQFITPLSVSVLSAQRVHRDLFTDDADMDHIQLARQADLVVVAPATADLIARHAHGRADDLATTTLLATTAPILMVPAMNPKMWTHPATQHNVALLRGRDVAFLGPEDGVMACGDFGPGRMADPDQICRAIRETLSAQHKKEPGSLSGLRAVVTAGPTHEPLDPVRYLANRSSGKQGIAIAAALHRMGADTTLVCGPTQQPIPPGITTLRVQTAAQMQDACHKTLTTGARPLDIAVCAAAVSDWCAKTPQMQKDKKTAQDAHRLELVKTPDILAEIATHPTARPTLVIGFAAETQQHLEQAQQKKARKGCDWILVNDVSTGTQTFGGDTNQVHVLRDQDSLFWPSAPKQEIARKLAAGIAQFFDNRQKK